MAFEVKTKEEIATELKLNLVEEGVVTDINPGSVLDSIVNAFAEQLETNANTPLQEVYDNTRIETATEDSLEELGKPFNVTRKAGLKSTGTVTFRRNNPAITNFTIPASTIVSTQPVRGTSVRFTTDSNGNFNKDISNEAHKYNDGSYYYKLDNRFVKTGSGDFSIEGEVSSVPTVLTYATDYQLLDSYDGILIDTSKTGDEVFEIIDDCEVTTGWAASTDATAIATTSVNEYQGTNALQIGKTGTSSAEASYEKTISDLDLSSRGAGLYLYFDSTSVIDKISSMKIEIGSSLTDYYETTVSGNNLNVGGALYEMGLTSDNIVGFPDITQLNRIKVTIVTKTSSFTTSAGDIVMDMWFGGVIESNYSGNVIFFDKEQSVPDEGTDFLTTYKPLSIDIAVTSEESGIDKNVGVEKIVFKVSAIANIDSITNFEPTANGTDQETDEELRQRILDVSKGLGKASVEAIRQAVLAVNGVASVSALDTPRKTITDEPLVYNTSITKYKLGFDIPYLDDEVSPTNIHISNSTGTSTDDYTYGTDYELATENGIFTGEVEWLGATTPSNGQTVYVDYQADVIGRLKLFVSSQTGTLPSSVQEEIRVVIDDTRSAGIFVSFSEPTIVSQDIVASVTVDSAYDETSVKNNVETALIAYVNSLGAGQDLYIAELYSIIMGVEGVVNSSITTPASDVTIDDDEVVKIGTVTIS